MSTPIPEVEYAGARLGFPAEGAGAVAGWGRRVLALFIDWFACLGLAAFISSLAGWDSAGDAARGLPMGVFLVEVTVFTAVLGGSFGQLVCRAMVTKLDGRTLNLLQALVRTLLILLVIPPLVFNRDNRGLHDLAVGSATRLR